MTKMHRNADTGSGETTQRVVLVVDNGTSTVSSLNDAWSQLRLADELQVVPDREAALDVLHDIVSNKGHDSVAAVVLDPDTTGESTGEFLREARARLGRRRVPVVLWTRNGQQYEVLEGRGVKSVCDKPRILRLVEVLDNACHLKR